MKGYNHVALIGNLVKDPENIELGNTEKTNFLLAVSRNYKNADKQEETDFIPIVSWGNLAKICKDYLGKGKRVLIDGRIQVRHYEKDSVKKWVTEIIADELTILSPPVKKEPKKSKAA
jgi:single-strand DNA-binding protein